MKRDSAEGEVLPSVDLVSTGAAVVKAAASRRKIVESFIARARGFLAVGALLVSSFVWQV